MNFTSPYAESLYFERRMLGWGLDPVRCARYMTSSQVLMLNILGPLHAFPEWAARVFKTMFRIDYDFKVKSIHIEYAPDPGSRKLGNATRVDALIEIESIYGLELLVMEIKYCDRFNSRSILIDTPPYRELVDVADIWTEAGVLLIPEVNQLVRCHALAASLFDLWGHPYRAPRMLVLHHPADAVARRIVGLYRAHLNNPMSALSATINEFVCEMERASDSDVQKGVCHDLMVRYDSESESDQMWQYYLSTL